MHPTPDPAPYAATGPGLPPPPRTRRAGTPEDRAPRSRAPFRRAPRVRLQRRPRALATAAAGACALLPALAGCNPPTGAPDRTPAAVDIATVPRSSVRDGGTLRWAVDALPATLNTFQAAADAQTTQVATAVLPTLFTVDGHGRPQRDPDYLLSADVVQRTPQQVVVYKLNPKAVWSDGRPVGADDFAAQWRALNGDDASYWSAHNDGYDRIAAVTRGADAHQVKVTFQRPYAAWQSLFTPLYPASVTGSPEAFNTRSRDRLPVSGGPFRLARTGGGEHGVTLVRNERWWGAPAKLDRLVLVAVDRDRRVAALSAGRADVAEVDPAALPEVVKDRSLTVHRAPEAGYTQLTLNGGSGPLADERVRRAIARAIDRQALADLVLRPAGLPARPLGNHFVMASQTGYQDNSAAIGKPDVKSAQALLGDAGWQPGKAAAAASAAAKAAPGPRRPSGPPGGDEDTAAGSRRDAERLAGRDAVVEPDAVRTDRAGHPLALRFVLPADDPTLLRVGDRIAHMLAGIGVRTRIDRVDGEGFFKDHVAAGDFDLALYSWPGSAYPVNDARPVYAKPVPGADGSLTVQQNYARVGTDQIDHLLDQAGAELDPVKARSLARRADARLWAVAGSLPLYQRPQLVVENKAVANAGAFGFATPRYQDIGFRKGVPLHAAGGPSGAPSGTPEPGAGPEPEGAADQAPGDFARHGGHPASGRPHGHPHGHRHPLRHQGE
ncbi:MULTISPECIES: ABC transporter family substrate-binding protein [Streptomycetaceae]|uniref:Extracellular solute-binding protein family 5 n=1 Tax=Streptantibioticus cattleyicolor (strain ATCC 35852 / DSM 46488 / JCM 4925 / NBRC 14057 / NRRL 8057) TaxID=1003195 RepID=F8K3J9_STREN|nr:MULTISPECIES: ABC transporter family substrate-binding protein [Streptomycetaceae]AEW96318.1 extracellular solute-binding protein family 5 [Streptantibioticus cattleyicolor NRRL 8057 = DSM 46488]MYS60833.1 ABC transporter family substrate-binding protein [Streptomyces sp. SID5468]CCB76657.1 Lipoprotein [Streptantibioticus cattleyicolor NRRL 8057 = DSM 46488]